MDVACSTLAFSHLPFDSAIRKIAELEFSRIDLAIAEGTAQFSPYDLVENPTAIFQQIRAGLVMNYVALTLRTSAAGEALLQQIDQTSHLAKQLAAPYLVVEASPPSTPFEEEVARLTEMEKACALHGTILTVVTRIGTWTEMPSHAIELCKAVKGLGLTLDPSHFLCGPNHGKSYTSVYPHVRHVQLRDSGRRADQLQVTVGRGEIDYGKIINALQQFHYRGALAVAVEATLAPPDMDVAIEARKLRLLLESLL